MIEERTGCDDLLASRSDGGCIGPLGDLVEYAFHMTDMVRNLDLGGGDGRCGLRNSGRGQQDGKYELGFHGWYDSIFRWLDGMSLRETNRCVGCRSEAFLD